MSARRYVTIVVTLAVVFALLLMYRGSNMSREAQQAAAAKPVGAPVTIAAPLGLPPVPVPADNPPTAETIALGRRLYYDPALSLDNTVSCASCHHPDKGFADDKPFSEGVQKKLGGRNSPTVLNAAYFPVQFWDGRAPSLEEQAKGPVQNPVEMAHTLGGVEERLSLGPTYKAEFEKAFGPGPITYDKVAKAIASFERTVVAANSPFDRYYYGHDKKALSPAAIRGFEVFRRADKGNCAACHTIADGYALFTDNSFHNIGVGVKNETPTDVGRFAVTKNETDKGCFKTPSLRNVALTAPYMHDGSLKDLKQVVDFYIGGGNSNPYRDPKIKPLDFLSGQERADLLEFLNSLNGEVPASARPAGNL